MHWTRILKRIIKWVVLPMLFLCAVVVTGCWILRSVALPPHDTDDVMLQNFHTNRTVFEEIVVSVSEDEDIRRIDENWYELADGIAREDSPDRITEYRELFKNISMERGIRVSYSSNGNARVLFYSNCIGLATGGSCKGYVYDPYPAGEPLLVDSIDDYDPQKDLWRSYWWVYKPIEGNDGWYLYCDFDD